MSIALAGCNGESGTTIEYLNTNPSNDPTKNPASAGFTVSYQKGNGAGSLPKPQLITKQDITDGTNKITLPDEEGLAAPKEGAVFVGWNDGTLSYPPKYEYTVTEDITFNARWAFTTLDDIKTCLADAGGAPVVIAVADAELPDEDLTWENLLKAIQTAGQTGKFIELDLSESTLALKDTTQFNYKDGLGHNYGTGEKYIKKLVMPRAATSIYNYSLFKDGPFLNLAAASGLNVSAIPDYAFEKLTTLAALVFPAAVNIGNSAFSGCAKLTQASLPAAVSIGQSAFNGCASLTQVSLPAAGTIGISAFGGCASLTQVSLPAAGSIGISAFGGCASLTQASLPAAESIGTSAFGGCASLTQVSLPAAKNIDQYAFSGCVNLSQASLPKDATEIGQYAFQNCYSLTEVNLPAAGTIGNNAFDRCTGLTSVNLPVAGAIAQSTFQNCSNLTSVSLPAAGTISNNAFYSCASLTEVNLPKDKAIYIGQYGFRYCFELSTITIGGDCGFYNDEVIPNNFITYYKSNIDHDAKAAGVYTYKGSSWSYEELPSE